MEEHIAINGHIIETDALTEGGKFFVDDASQSNYILLQCQGRLTNDNYEVLNPLKVQVLEYIHLNSYLCRYEPHNLEVLRTLPFVISANVYHQDLVINQKLQTEFEALETLEDELVPEKSAPTSEKNSLDKPQKFMVELHPMADRTPEEIKQQFADLLHQDPREIHVSNSFVTMKALPQDLQAIAAIEEVRTIEEVPVLTPHINMARKDIGIPKLTGGCCVTRAPAGRYDGLTQAILDGDGQRVCVADTGFDIGFQGTAVPGVTPRRDMFQDRVRIEQLQIPAGVNFIDSLNARTGRATARTVDKDSHGTFVAGCVAADGKAGMFGFRKTVRGSAPKAEILCQVRDSNTGAFSSINTQLLESAWTQGARVHNNSYGKDIDPAIGQTFTAYDISARVIDDYTTKGFSNDGGLNWQDRSQMVVVCSAGNNGDVLGVQTIGSANLAKNAITVGACESSRPVTFIGGKYKYDRTPWSVNGSPNDVAIFSARGPVAVGPALTVPMKPDILAPGVCILSARTNSTDFHGFPMPDGTFSVDRFGVAPDNQWVFDSGSSFSTPLVSGCAAVLRQALISSGRSANPTASLIKALLINGAVDLQNVPRLRAGGHIPGPPPDSHQGFGRVNMDASLLNITDIARGSIMENGGIAQGAPSTTFPIDPAAGGVFNVRATMCFADRAGVTLQSQLVLRLIHTPPGGAANIVRNANTNSAVNDDRLNNVQKVVWMGVPAGGTTVLQVDPVAITGAGYLQAFSMAWWVWQ